MPAHLRVSLADRPGALATLTRALAAAGANVLSVAVLQRESGRAVDDLILDWPFPRSWDAVVRAVEGTQGARMHGLRHLEHVDPVPDAEVLRQVVAQPHRGVEVLVDALPGLLLADWAAVTDRREGRQASYASPDSPVPLPALPASLPRPRALSDGEAPVVAVPFDGGDQRLLVGRRAGPGFTRSERDRATLLLETVLELESALPRQPARTNSLTTLPSSSPASS
jgi:hypothetical protein